MTKSLGKKCVQFRKRNVLGDINEQEGNVLVFKTEMPDTEKSWTKMFGHVPFGVRT